jgi:hypothetical protein
MPIRKVAHLTMIESQIVSVLPSTSAVLCHEGGVLCCVLGIVETSNPQFQCDIATSHPY